MLLTTKKLILTMTAAFGLASFAAPVLSQSTAPSAKTATSSTAKKTSAGKGKAVKTTAKRTTKKASAKRTSIKKNAKKTKKARRAKRRTGSSPSQATLAGLRKTADPLLLGSSVAYAVDQDTGEELVVKNADVPLPIASVTKLMTALVIAESDLPLDDKVRITREDYVRSNAYSKLTNGMVMTREALLKAALMSSDNRAAHALARSYPGGKKQFIARMNETAAELGMTDSFFADPTGLDNRNHSTARDLGKLVAVFNIHTCDKNALGHRAFAGAGGLETLARRVAEAVQIQAVVPVSAANQRQTVRTLVVDDVVEARFEVLQQRSAVVGVAVVGRCGIEKAAPSFHDRSRSS